jgi:simple sugar transport system ATP-binding protein
VTFHSPRDARDRGIATVYQDLAMVPLMSIWRNFFLGAEPTKGRGPLKVFDVAFAKDVVRTQLRQMGIDIRDPDQPVGTLSGGERQSVAIARAVYFGARVLIHHAYPVGDRFVVLNRGQSIGSFRKSEIDQTELVRLMAGGSELAALEHELEQIKAEVGSS